MEEIRGIFLVDKVFFIRRRFCCCIATANQTTWNYYANQRTWIQKYFSWSGISNVVRLENINYCNETEINLIRLLFITMNSFFKCKPLLWHNITFSWVSSTNPGSFRVVFFLVFPCLHMVQIRFWFLVLNHRKRN